MMFSSLLQNLFCLLNSKVTNLLLSLINTKDLNTHFILNKVEISLLLVGKMCHSSALLSLFLLLKFASCLCSHTELRRCFQSSYASYYFLAHTLTHALPHTVTYALTCIHIYFLIIIKQLELFQPKVWSIVIVYVQV